jgi:hypothetical protein
MPSFMIRLLISSLLVLHLMVVALAVLGHRGASYIHDDMLSFLAPYTALGNWKADANRMPIASSNALEEIVRVEWHQRDAANDAWEPLVPSERPHRMPLSSTLDRRQRLEQYWLHQLSGLLVYENDEGVGRMLMAAVKSGMNGRAEQMDRIRVTVAPRLSQQQYIEVQSNEESNTLPDLLKPQTAYSASIIDLGDGQLSLLRQTEARRASKTLAPVIPSTPKDGAKPR